MSTLVPESEMAWLWKNDASSVGLVMTSSGGVSPSAACTLTGNS